MINQQDFSKAITAEDLIRRYNLDNLKTNRKDIELLKKNTSSTDAILDQFIIATTNNFIELQNQVDGNITTWFFNGTPTLYNEPAVNWTTEDLKIVHLGDLYYDQSTGYAYRFVKEGNVFSWSQLSDSAVVEALALAGAAKDTADAKRRVFVATPTPPYDVGDLWITSTRELYRCITATTESGTYNPDHWIVATKYTDDYRANEAYSLASTVQTELHRDYATSADLTIASDQINSTVKAIEITGYYTYTLTTDTNYQSGKYYFNSQQQLLIEGTDYDVGDSIPANSVYERTWTETLRNEMISAINQSPEQIAINANKISLAGKNINLTSDNIEISSTNFSVDHNGNLQCQNADISGNIEAETGSISGFVINEDGISAKVYAPYDFTQADSDRVYAILMGQITPTQADYDKYDLNGDGRIDLSDWNKIAWYVMAGVSTTVPAEIKAFTGGHTAKTGFYVNGGNGNESSMTVFGISSNQVATDKLYAPNTIKTGTASITPVANTPTSYHVTFIEPFDDVPIVTATAESAVIGSTLKGVSVANVTKTGFDIYIYRTNTTSTNVNWIAITDFTSGY